MVDAIIWYKQDALSCISLAGQPADTEYSSFAGSTEDE